jgi:hypothetical protein
MRRLTVLIAVMAGAVGLAQADAMNHAQVGSPAELAQLVARSTDEILLAVPVLRSRIVADALREAMVVRGVRVYALVPREGIEARAAYLVSLQLAGARVRLGSVRESLLVLDRQEVVVGPLLAAPDVPREGEVASWSHDPQEVLGGVTWFYEAFRAAPTYELNPRVLEGGNDER